MWPSCSHSIAVVAALHLALLVQISRASTPVNVSIPHVGGRFVRVAWHNDGSTSTNIVYIHRLQHVPESGTAVEELTFDEFANPSKQTVDVTGDIARHYPSLDGSSLIYLPTNSVGQIMISKRDGSGLLVHSAFDDYSSLWLELLLKRYNHVDELNSMNIGYIGADGGTTNVTSVALENEFQRRIVPLADVIPGCRLVLNKASRNRNNRVIIDEMRFIRDYREAHTETNLVSATIVAGRASARLKNLDRETDYLVSVSSLGPSGVESAPSPPLAFRTTAGRDMGFSASLR